MGKFEEEYKRLNAAQAAAVDAIDGPVLVIAGPGTGKTQLLSMRVANILRRTDVNPGNILCLTYTESGQQAMRQRLTQLLGKPAKKVEIHTFHGFGNYIIGRFSEHFPELEGFRPADDLALYETMRDCLERLPRNNPLSKMSYGQFIYQADASARISQLKQAGISPEQACDLAEQDTKWCAEAGAVITKAFSTIGRLSPKSIPLLQQELASVLDGTHESNGLGDACTSELTQVLEEAAASNKTAPLSAFKKRWFVSEDGSLYFRPKDQLKKLSALVDLYAMYEAEMQSRKLYDYDDMILYALQKLEYDKELLAEVQETFQYILADEYQDTNAAQAKIITLIASNPVNENRPNVMVVGDDDQAIYGFQGALGDVLLHFREAWRDVTTITLKDNYRSTQPILDLARQAIRTGQKRLENYYEDIDKTLTANATYRPQPPAMHITTSHEAVLDLAVHAAKSAGSDRQLAIIAPKHKYLKELADRLDAAHVDYFYEGREDLLKDPALNNVLMLASCALAVKEREYGLTNYILPELITTGALDITRPQAWRIAVQARQQSKSWWEVLASDSIEGLENARTNIRALADSLDAADAKGSLAFVARTRNIHRQRHIRALVEHAKKYLGRDTVSLHELLRYIELCKLAGIALSETFEKGNREANILLLSAHKSKGLEFDRVHVLHADYYTWFKERGRINTISLPPGWQYIEPERQTLDDRLRLLYVVMTRAKQELSLIKSNIRTAHTDKQTDNLPGTDDIQTFEQAAPSADSILSSPQAEEQWQSWYLPTDSKEQQQLRTILDPVLSQYRLSASHLTTFLDIAHGGPLQLFAHSLLGIPAPAHPEALFGNGVHQTLRFCQETLNATGKLPDNEQLAHYIRTHLPTMRDDQRNDVVSAVREFIDHTAILERGGVSEFSFQPQDIQIDGIRITGNVDHYIEKDGIVHITDFKTGRAINSWRVTEDYYKQKLHRFRLQLLFYDLLFRLSPMFNNITGTSLKIAFVEPSRRDVYCELPLEADDQSREELTKLMAAVWKHIITLDFPDTSSYGTDMNGLAAFQDDLLAGLV